MIIVFSCLRGPGVLALTWAIRRVGAAWYLDGGGEVYARRPGRRVAGLDGGGEVYARRPGRRVASQARGGLARGGQARGGRVARI
jgi:hypothetical protein